MRDDAETAAMAVRKAREANEEFDLGMGLLDCKRAAEVAIERFEGDALLGLLWVSANAYAISVGRHLPTEEARKEARAAWNDAHARERAKALLADGRDPDPQHGRSP